MMRGLASPVVRSSMDEKKIMNAQDFDAACRATVDQLFDDIRRLTASPAPRTGVTRLGYSDEEEATVQHLEAQGRKLGLEAERDAAGNLWLTLPGRDRSLPAIAAGSHADSVLDGGNYDGLAGIACALCVVLWLKSQRVTLARDYRVLVIRSEEQGLIGTTAVLGNLQPEDLERRFTADGPTLAQRLARRGLDAAPLVAGKPLIDLTRLAAFLEAHIEQTERLDASPNRRVGLVTGIRGVRMHRVIRCEGETGHAGAVEFPARHDAVAACARFVAEVYERWQHCLAMGKDLVVTTGMIRTPDTAIFNKISGVCEMSLDMRSLDDATFADFSREIDDTMARIAAEMGVTFVCDPAVILPPNHSDEQLLKRLAHAAEQEGIGLQTMASGAGHDAANFGAAGVPFAMLFIANQNGSHNPREAMKTEDLFLAARVMTRAVLDFDQTA